MSDFAPPIGSTLHLRGLTLRGKNRIRRGGHLWRVEGRNPNVGTFVMSARVGNRECFWIAPNEQNVLVLEVLP